MQKLSRLILVLALAAFALTACSGTNPTAAPATQAVATQAPTNTSLPEAVTRIDLGSDVPYTDSQGNVWMADQNFRDAGGQADRGDIAIQNTDVAHVFQTEAWGMPAYHFPIANGTYKVNLLFVETNNTAADLRLFSVTMEEQKIITDMDVFAEAGGQNKALVKTFNATVKDGSLDLGFTATKDGPMISGIEIFGALVTMPTSTATVLPTTTPTPMPTSTMDAGVVYEAESAANTLSGAAAVVDCIDGSGEKCAGSIGQNDGTLQFNGIQAASAATYRLTIVYRNGDDGARMTLMSVNDAVPVLVSFPSYGSWATTAPLVHLTIDVNLKSGDNTIKFSDGIGQWAPDLDMISISNAAVPAPAVMSGTRDVKTWPFARNSIWNMPIGSGAVYLQAGIGAQDFNGFDEDYFFEVKPGDPWKPLFEVGNWGIGRCTGKNPFGEIQIPNDLLLKDATGDSTPNNAAALLQPDGRTLVQLEPMARCAAGDSVYGYRAVEQDIYGAGIYGGHFGSGLSSIGGTLRKGEILPTTGPIQHALKLELQGSKYYFFSDAVGYRWPADRPDSYAGDLNNKIHYAGTNHKLVMGSLLAIPPSVTAESIGLETEVGKKLFQALQDYGGYLADDTAWQYSSITAEGGIYDEVVSFKLDPWDAKGAFHNDLNKLFSALMIVDNNGPTNIGGGGTPRQPLAPELSTQPGPDMTKLSSKGWKITTFEDDGTNVAANAIDGDPLTVWRSGKEVADGQNIVLDLGSNQTFSRLVMDNSGPYAGEWPQGFTISTSQDGKTWSVVAAGSGAAEKIQISFQPQTARYIKIDAQPFVIKRNWAIAEIELYK